MKTDLNAKPTFFFEEVFELAPRGPLSIYTMICPTDADAERARNLILSAGLKPQQAGSPKMVSVAQPADAKDPLRISLQELFPHSNVISKTKG